MKCELPVVSGTTNVVYDVKYLNGMYKRTHHLRLERRFKHCTLCMCRRAGYNSAGCVLLGSSLEMVVKHRVVTTNEYGSCGEGRWENALVKAEGNTA